MDAKSIPHPYFETIVHEKDGRYIGTPSQEFWDSWRSARYPKRGPNKGNIGAFRESWGMFKADPNDMDEILETAEKGSSVSFVNSTQKDDHDACGAIWFIVNLKPIGDARKDIHEACDDGTIKKTQAAADMLVVARGLDR